MRRRSPARWLAPLALVACAGAIYVVVDQELLSKNDGASKTSSVKTSTTKSTHTTTTKKKTKKATTYVVKSGDSFSVIAAKEGVDIGALQEANPKVDASALHPGQKLKLPR